MLAEATYRKTTPAEARPLSGPDARARIVCRRLAARCPQASRLVAAALPVEMHDDALAIVAFDRGAAACVAGARSSAEGHRALDEWEEQLERAFFGEATRPVFVSLGRAIEARDLPLPPLRAIIAGHRLALDGARPATFEAQCARLRMVSAPWGQLLLALLGERDAALHPYVEDLCMGWQLAWALAGIGRDPSRGLIAIPAEDLRHYGITDAAFADEDSPRTREILCLQVMRAGTFLLRGRPLLERLSGPSLGAFSQLMDSALATLDALPRHPLH